MDDFLKSTTGDFSVKFRYNLIDAFTICCPITNVIFMLFQAITLAGLQNIVLSLKIMVKWAIIET